MSTTEAMSIEPYESVTVIDGGRSVNVRRGERIRQVPARWLRLLASDSASVHPVSGQRSFDSVSLPSEIRVRSATFMDDQGSWEVRFEGETSTVVVEVDRLLACGSIEDIDGPERTPFSSADQPGRAIDHEDLESPAALRSFLETLFRRGYVRVRGVPTSHKDLARFARRLGCPGDHRDLGIFEEFVTADDADDANSSRGGAPHTDEAFRDPVPAFHVQLCMEDSTDRGDIFMVDGMTVAATLAAEAPVAAAELARWPMLFEYRDEKVDFRRAVPLFETTPDGHLRRITFNDRAAVDFICPDDRLPICADAYDQLARIVLREGLQNRFRIQAGDLFLFDNERVLHGRSPISGSGSRRLACCYLDRGDLLSTWRRARSGDLD